MNNRSWFYIFICAYAGCWLLFFISGLIGKSGYLLQIADIFEKETANFLFLTFLFLAVALMAAEVGEFLHRYLIRFRPFRPRLGDVLVQEGFITGDDLDEALEIQRMRLGDVLVDSGHITRGQLTHALVDQKRKTHRKLGEILRELGYARARDIRWGLSQLNRKLGRILVDMQLIRDDDLKQVLGRLWYGRYGGV